MRIVPPVVMIALCLLASAAEAAGFRFIDVPADAEGPALSGALWYPCAESPGRTQFGPYVLPVGQLVGAVHP